MGKYRLSRKSLDCPWFNLKYILFYIQNEDTLFLASVPIHKIGSIVILILQLKHFIAVLNDSIKIQTLFLQIRFQYMLWVTAAGIFLNSSQTNPGENYFFMILMKDPSCRFCLPFMSIYTYKTWILSVCVFVCPRFSQPPKVPASWNFGSRPNLGQLKTWRIPIFEILIFKGGSPPYGLVYIYYTMDTEK